MLNDGTALADAPGPGESVPDSRGGAPGTSNELPLAAGLSREFLLHHRICPSRILPDGTLAVAVEPESLLSGLDDLSVAYQRPVAPEPLSTQDVQLLIERLTSSVEEDITLEDRAVDEDAFASDMRDLANQPPVVRYVNLVVGEASSSGASDVHLEWTRDGLRARFRIDGVLIPALEPPAGLGRAVVSRVKLLADLDIAERRRPQDGRIRVRLEGGELDLRVSTVPSIFGESVVLRLLERGARRVALEELGLGPDLLTLMARLARKPHGMILATGPTGSGKTTTLYAALGLRDPAREKIITVEDPVEYALDGIIQVPVQRQIGVTFGSMLRSILRQDPDVLMVGEMRDGETAELAVQAALTGHVVFSTLHTNDAVGAIPRLTDLGVPPYLVAATVDGILAQRLVRRTCDACREPYEPAAGSVAAIFGGGSGEVPVAFTRGRGCDACRGTGYRGRTGLFELLVLTSGLKEAVLQSAPRSRLDELAIESGMVPLRTDGRARIGMGITTVEEMLRVTQD